MREEVQSGRFPSETAVLEEALALLRRREREQFPQRGETGIRSIGEIIDELMSKMPEDVLNRLPIDGAAQHDLYGTPEPIEGESSARPPGGMRRCEQSAPRGMSSLP